MCSDGRRIATEEKTCGEVEFYIDAKLQTMITDNIKRNLFTDITG